MNMEYNTIFAKSFSRYEQKKFGYGAFLGSLIFLLTIFTVFRPSFHHLPILNLRVSMNAGLAMLMFEDTNVPPRLEPLVGFADESPTAESEVNQDLLEAIADFANESSVVVADSKAKQERLELPASFANESAAGTQTILPRGLVAESELKQERPDALVNPVNELSVVAESEIKQEYKAVCNVEEPRADYCNIDGDVRVHGNSSTIFFSPSQMGNMAGNESWRIRPYARKGDSTAMGDVTELSVKSIVDDQVAPHCTIKHSVPAIIFSAGGYAGNHFHDFADIIVPLFVTSRQFHGEVQFLVTNARSFWLAKYKPILNALSRYEIIDMDKENEVHCFPKVIIGLYQFHNDLRINPSKTPNGYSMTDFRQFLRNTYSLKKTKAIKISDRRRKKPRLLIISRKRTRSFTNEGEIVKMAKSLGFTVVVEEPGMGGMTAFAETVNSCDVMMGVHGAGLTNLVFLPTNAILIQVEPWGNLNWLCSHYFGEAAVDMKLRYLQYSIRKEESSLIQQYPLDHAVFKDPMSIHKQGWNAVKSTYLDKQNVKLDVDRFKGTLLKALLLLHH